MANFPDSYLKSSNAHDRNINSDQLILFQNKERKLNGDLIKLRDLSDENLTPEQEKRFFAFLDKLIAAEVSISVFDKPLLVEYIKNQSYIENCENLIAKNGLVTVTETTRSGTQHKINPAFSILQQLRNRQDIIIDTLGLNYKGRMQRIKEKEE